MICNQCGKVVNGKWIIGSILKIQQSTLTSTIKDEKRGQLS